MWFQVALIGLYLRQTRRQDLTTYTKHTFVYSLNGFNISATNLCHILKCFPDEMGIDWIMKGKVGFQLEINKEKSERN